VNQVTKYYFGGPYIMTEENGADSNINSED